MTPVSWLVTALLAGAAVVVAWPVRSSRRRRRSVLGAPPGSTGSPGPSGPPDATGSMGVTGSNGVTASMGVTGSNGFTGSNGLSGSTETGRPAGAAGDGTDRQAPAESGRPATGGRALRWMVSGPPRRILLLVGLAGAGAGGLAAGPVAAVLLAGYGMLGARTVHRRRAAGQVGRERRRQLDRLGALAADLRAGLPVPTLGPTDATSDADRRVAASPAHGTGDPVDDRAGEDRLERLARSAVRLADRTGAPLAELLERVEADARAFDRGLAGAAAQAAGANATALLLAALPLGGIALGYGIGVDPLAVLLHTPVGAGCALAAMGLQTGGLLWAERLGSTSGGGG
ncbi:hypothetical protein ACIG87_14960 [Micromonospora sp. NPDC051925]|uniref:hypothetical protein n=1 Tax=Micromonospora sp. NPDC051925 TaxID=3364288 RepID=UPI0037C9EF0A